MPSRIGIISLRSATAIDCSLASSAWRRATASASGAARCARAGTATARRKKPARTVRIGWRMALLRLWVYSSWYHDEYTLGKSAGIGAGLPRDLRGRDGARPAVYEHGRALRRHDRLRLRPGDGVAEARDVQRGVPQDGRFRRRRHFLPELHALKGAAALRRRLTRDPQ